ncbi:flippase activity-associated protein Agl23 [Halocatena marina]|uniref:flippase activity-associated protein Agl23 n=1 Tax=Halocatena marina TaxID=2934937 RepID=UPI0022256602|nr:flippase activity-associated protein Agl23 [Halocatena marina]
MELPAHTNRDWERNSDRYRTIAFVVSITVFALIARFMLLGDRVAHWDEARVGFWTLDYIQTGNYSYMPVIHGPFYHHVNPLLFELFGTTDATMRIAPALVTGLLPLTALLLRDRLRRLEVVALALFLAIDPVVLYYSRFMRGDPLVGAFMFAAFAFLVRAVDTPRTRYILGATGAIALGFSAKENALVYLLCWIGALAVLLDQRLLVARYRDREWLAVAVDNSKRVIDGLSRHRTALLAGLVEFLIISVMFYAPRKNGSIHVSETNVGLNAITNPSLLFDVVVESTAGSFSSLYSFWVVGGRAEHAYLPYLGDLLLTIGYGSVALCLLALIGFLVNRYAADQPRPIVTFTFAWGVASLIGYPLITDIKAPWAAVHVVLPLAVPAAVGAGVIVRKTYGAVTARRWANAGVLGLVLLLASTQVVGMAVHSVYLEPQSPDNELVQYAQPTDDIHPTVHEIEQIAQKEDEGTDVLIYGSPLVKGNPIYNKPSCTRNEGWFDTLPLPWYLVRSEATVACAESESDLNAINGTPPVIITQAEHVTKNESGQTVTVPTVPDELKTRFEGYDTRIKRIRTSDTDIVFLIDRNELQGTQNASQMNELASPPDRHVAPGDGHHTL